MVPTLTTVGRTVGASNGHPRLDDGRVLEDVRTVIWCTGFRPDFRWIQLPVFGPEGYPHHRRGIVAGAPGLGFVGLRHQTRIGSSLIGGVREDAEVRRPTVGLAQLVEMKEPLTTGIQRSGLFGHDDLLVQVGSGRDIGSLAHRRRRFIRRAGLCTRITKS